MRMRNNPEAHRRPYIPYLSSFVVVQKKKKITSGIPFSHPGPSNMLDSILTSPLIHNCEPIVWHLASALIFILIIHQPHKSRWLFLPLILLPLIQCYNTVDQLPGGLDWIYAFTSIVTITHTTSVLYIEEWSVPPPKTKSGEKWNVPTAFKLWMDPRRITYIKVQSDVESPTQYQRLIFVIRGLSQILILSVIYTAIELLLLLLDPSPSNFALPNQTYVHFRLDRQAIFRTVYAFHWAWLTFLILTVAHTIMSIIFVGILQFDAPSEWPSLYGSPLKFTSVRSFWGQFWHRLGSPSQASYGRLFSRRVLKLSANGSTEKVFLAFWIFLVSGITHVFLSWKTEPKADDHFSDMRFLIVNFLGGVVESLVVKWAKGGRWGKVKKQGVFEEFIGFLWVFFFFYVTVPPYQFPVLYKTAVERAKVGMSI